MRILADFHHSDLWWSHHLIFEKALGHELFRPRGMDWFDHGYYRHATRDVASQFLEGSLFPLEEVVKYPSCRRKIPAGTPAGTMASMDTLNGCLDYPLIRTLTLDEFRDAKIDVIMPTVSENQEPWIRLKRELAPTAKLVREEGNVQGWANLHREYPNVLTSDLTTFRKAQAPNKLLYHQRFDLGIFSWTEPAEFDKITSFMPGFRGTHSLVGFAEQHDFGKMQFIDYGHQSRLGFLPTKERYAAEMRKTAFVWHVKPGGDGFGHVLHNSMAMGRPIITMERDYADSLARPLLEDRKTCILIGGDPAENSEKIASLSDPETIKAMSHEAAVRFRDVVDYDLEADQVDAFLERLV